MVHFIDAWVKETGQKLDNPIPDTWIRDGVTPHLTDVDPNAPISVAPSPPTEAVPPPVLNYAAPDAPPSPTEAVPPPVPDAPAPDSPNTEEA